MIEFNKNNKHIEEPYTGTKLVKTMIGMLPKCWSTEVRLMKEKLETAKTLGDVSAANTAIAKLIDDCYDDEDAVAPPVAPALNKYVLVYAKLNGSKSVPPSPPSVREPTVLRNSFLTLIISSGKI